MRSKIRRCWLESDSITGHGRTIDQGSCDQHVRLELPNKTIGKRHGPSRSSVERGENSRAAGRDLVRQKRNGAAGRQSSNECAEARAIRWKQVRTAHPAMLADPGIKHRIRQRFVQGRETAIFRQLVLKPEIEPFPVPEMGDKKKPALRSRGIPEKTGLSIKHRARRQRIATPPSTSNVENKTPVSGKTAARQAAARASGQFSLAKRQVPVSRSRHPQGEHVCGQTDRLAGSIEKPTWKCTKEAGDTFHKPSVRHWRALRMRHDEGKPRGDR